MKSKVFKIPILLAAAFTIPTSAFASEECASGTKDLTKTPALVNLLHDFGGLGQLTGFWKLGGLAYAIQPTVIRLTASSNSFTDQVAHNNKQGVMHLDTPGTVLLCANSAEPTVLYVRPVHAIDPANALIRIKPVAQDEKISLCNKGNGYHTFNRADGFPPLGESSAN